MDLRVTRQTEKSGASLESNFQFHNFKVWLVLLLAILAGLSIYYFRFDLRACSLLIEFLSPKTSSLIVRWEAHPVDAQEVIVPLMSGSVRARLYVPRGVTNPPGMVLIHGIHHLGIDEPRLISFAQAAAANGFAVLTPELAALADYHVDASSIPTIGESTIWLQQRLETGPVSIVAVSFAGGLSLLAALDSRYAPHIRSLLLMGAYDDLARVLRFLATDQAELPDGRWEPYKAHDYGAAVFVYSDLDHFFSAGDLSVAHDALRDWLWEEPEDAKALLSRLSPAGQRTMNLLLARQIDQLRPKLLEEIQADQSQMAAISPQGKLAALRVPVFVLHGLTDDIIPSTESLWLEQEIPRPYLKAALITPAFSHVDPEKDATWGEELQLVGFLGNFLRFSE